MVEGKGRREEDKGGRGIFRSDEINHGVQTSVLTRTGHSVLHTAAGLLEQRFYSKQCLWSE